MEEATSQILPILQTLLPGFVSMIIFHWLSEVPKAGQFEQVIQALVCSAVITGIVMCLKAFAFWVGQWFVVASWHEWYDTGWTTLFSILLGFLLAYSANNNILYWVAHRLKLTRKTFASISEWDLFVRSFRDDPTLRIVLNLLDGRRLRGYPRVWPANPAGHFLMEEPCWMPGEKKLPRSGIEFIIIANVDVLWVEILE